MSLKKLGVFLIFLFVFLYACQLQQPATEQPQEEVITQTSEQAVSTLSTLKSKSVVAAVSEEEKIELKKSVSQTAKTSDKFSEDVDILLKLSKQSGYPALLDAAIRLKKLYSGNSIDFYIEELHDQFVVSGEVEETLDEYTVELSEEIVQAQELIDQISTLAEESGSSIVLNHLSSMKEDFSELSDNVEAVTEEISSSLGVGDLDDDGVLDYVDIDVDNDGIEDDLNGDGIITLDDLPAEGDLDLDGIANIEDVDFNGDGIEEQEIEEIIDGIGLMNELFANGYQDFNDDGLIDYDEYTQQRVDIEEFDTNNDGILNEEDFVIADNDFDDDGIVDWEDSDVNGNGQDDIEEFDTNNDGILNEEDFANLDMDSDGIPDSDDEDINGDGIKDDLTFVGDVHESLEHKSFVEESYGEAYDTDEDGIPDYSDEDIDNDGELNTDDTDDDNDGIEDSVEFYMLEKLVDGGIDVGVGDVGVIAVGEYYEYLDQPKEFSDYKKEHVDEYRNYMDQNPDFTQELENFFSECADCRAKYEQFILDNAEFYDAEARYYVEYDPNVVTEHPEFYVMPSVSAYFEAEDLPEHLDTWFEEHPEAQQKYESAKESYDDYKAQYSDEFEQHYNDLYGEEGYWGNDYDSLYDYGGDYQHEEAWESGYYVGGYDAAAASEVSGYYGFGESAGTSYSGDTGGYGGGGEGGGYSGGGDYSGGDAGGGEYSGMGDGGGGTGYAILLYDGWY